jgi:hypothetical protein
MKTAVQELVDELLFVESIKENEITKSNKAILTTAAIKQAFEKEKEQIIKSHIDGFDHIVAEFKKQEYAEEYFNKTYKNQTP